MTYATDQNTNREKLSINARRMLDLREYVFSVWEERVRARVSQADALRHPILVNTLPAFYDNIAESMSPLYPRTSATDGSTLAAEHGGERARITAYDHSALIEEYQILRSVIFDVFHRENIVLDHQEVHAVNTSIDGGIQEAVEAFSLVHSGFRERFAAALTHDLRGPLSAAMTGIELILLVDDLSKIKMSAAKSLSNLERMGAMINELLDTMAFHGGQQLQLQIVEMDICEVVKEVQADTLAAYGPRVQLLECAAKGWWDRAAMKRVVENLISNAIKYGSPDTPITIKINEEYERLLLSVHNEGQPIPPSEQECIFQMYRRADAAKHSSKQGWGIGLPYVRAVAESHNGSIGVDSSLERGTTFLIDIPIDGRLHHNGPTLATG